MTDQRPMIDHGEYKPIVCEHHRDIVTCADCDIFGGRVEIKFAGSKWDMVRHPIKHLYIRLALKQFTRRHKSM